MNSYDKILLGIYGITLAAVIVLLIDLWALAALFVLVLIISLTQKIYLEEKIDKEIRNRNQTITMILQRLEVFLSRMEELKGEIGKGFYTVENRLAETRSEHQKDIDMNYRELARKIFEVENHLNAAKKTFSAALGVMDERLGAHEE